MTAADLHAEAAIDQRRRRWLRALWTAAATCAAATFVAVAYPDRAHLALRFMLLAIVVIGMAAAAAAAFGGLPLHAVVGHRRKRASVGAQLPRSMSGFIAELRSSPDRSSLRGTSAHFRIEQQFQRILETRYHLDVANPEHRQRIARLISPVAMQLIRDRRPLDDVYELTGPEAHVHDIPSLLAELEQL